MRRTETDAELLAGLRQTAARLVRENMGKRVMVRLNGELVRVILTSWASDDPDNVTVAYDDSLDSIPFPFSVTRDSAGYCDVEPATIPVLSFERRC
jgi:hypothetical protein